MSWIAITEANLLTRLSGRELDRLRQAALKDGQEDPVQPTIDSVTRYVRSRVAACDQNQLGEGQTIPDELLDAALSILVMRIMNRVGGISIDPKDARQKAADDAESILRDVAKCNLRIEQPAMVTTEKVTSGSITVVSANKRRATRKQLEGL